MTIKLFHFGVPGSSGLSQLSLSPRKGSQPNTGLTIHTHTHSHLWEIKSPVDLMGMITVGGSQLCQGFRPEAFLQREPLQLVIIY